MVFESSAQESSHLVRKTPSPSLWIWIVPVLAVGAGHLLTAELSPVIRMLVITALLFVGMKAVVLSSSLNGQGPHGKNVMWFLFWPGMRPVLFCSRSGNRKSDRSRLFRQGLIRFGLGLGFLALTHLDFPVLLRMLLVMAGWSLVLHFGLFALLTVFFQHRGWKVRQPFFEPWRASSLGDFWSRRWNAIFSEMLSLSVYRPVVARFGYPVAVLAVFAVSGLLHEAAITLPVGTGYGGPFCYFLLQGLLVLLEKTKKNESSGLSRMGCFLAILLPLPLLFPPAFVCEVLLPLAGVRL